MPDLTEFRQISEGELSASAANQNQIITVVSTVYVLVRSIAAGNAFFGIVSSTDGGSNWSALSSLVGVGGSISTATVGSPVDFTPDGSGGAWLVWTDGANNILTSHLTSLAGAGTSTNWIKADGTAGIDTLTFAATPSNPIVRLRANGDKIICSGSTAGVKLSRLASGGTAWSAMIALSTGTLSSPNFLEFANGDGVVVSTGGARGAVLKCIAANSAATAANWKNLAQNSTTPDYLATSATTISECVSAMTADNVLGVTILATISGTKYILTFSLASTDAAPPDTVGAAACWAASAATGLSVAASDKYYLSFATTKTTAKAFCCTYADPLNPRAMQSYADELVGDADGRTLYLEKYPATAASTVWLLFAKYSNSPTNTRTALYLTRIYKETKVPVPGAKRMRLFTELGTTASKSLVSLPIFCSTLEYSGFRPRIYRFGFSGITEMPVDRFGDTVQFRPAESLQAFQTNGRYYLVVEQGNTASDALSSIYPVAKTFNGEVGVNFTAAVTNATITESDDSAIFTVVGTNAKAQLKYNTSYPASEWYLRASFIKAAGHTLCFAFESTAPGTYYPVQFQITDSDFFAVSSNSAKTSETASSAGAICIEPVINGQVYDVELSFSRGVIKAAVWKRATRRKIINLEWAAQTVDANWTALQPTVTVKTTTTGTGATSLNLIAFGSRTSPEYCFWPYEATGNEVGGSLPTYFAHFHAVDPADGKVYFGKTIVSTGVAETKLYVSSDNLMTWSVVKDFSPQAPSAIWFGSDGVMLVGTTVPHSTADPKAPGKVWVCTNSSRSSGNFTQALTFDTITNVTAARYYLYGSVHGICESYSRLPNGNKRLFIGTYGTALSTAAGDIWPYTPNPKIYYSDDKGSTWTSFGDLAAVCTTNPAGGVFRHVHSLYCGDPTNRLYVCIGEMQAGYTGSFFWVISDACKTGISATDLVSWTPNTTQDDIGYTDVVRFGGFNWFGNDRLPSGAVKHHFDGANEVAVSGMLFAGVYNSYSEVAATSNLLYILPSFDPTTTIVKSICLSQDGVTFARIGEFLNSNAGQGPYTSELVPGHPYAYLSFRDKTFIRDQRMYMDHLVYPPFQSVRRIRLVKQAR